MKSLTVILCLPIFQISYILCIDNITFDDNYTYDDNYSYDANYTYDDDGFTLVIASTDDWDCKVPGTGQDGRLMKDYYCPNGEKLPRACDYEICSDIVCCPNQHRNRLAQTCFYTDEPKYLQSLYFGIPCTVKNSNQSGITGNIDDCPSFANKNMTVDDIGRVCDFTFCKNLVCCPKVHIAETICTTYFYNNHEVFNDILMVGEPCVLKTTNQKGLCTASRSCKSIAYGTPDLQLCGINSCQHYICCPYPDYEKLTQSERACDGFKNTVYKRVHIIKEYESLELQRLFEAISPSGGVSAGPREFPHMAVLGFETKDEEVNWNCGGSLISDQFVLTAGHCIYSRPFGPVTYVRLGIIDLDVKENDIRDDCPEEFKVIERIPHPEYKSNSRYNDIGLLKLDRKVIFSPNIRPACLSDSRDIPEDEKLTAMGFGRTGDLEERTEKLIKVNLQQFSYNECSETYNANTDRRLKKGIMDTTQFCAGSRNSIQDTCLGDSGGPIQIEHDKYYAMAKIVGVTSFGKACGFQNVPGVYTRVYAYLKWIEEIVWPIQNS